jgi:membrane associated rhomboid family serine protease
MMSIHFPRPTPAVLNLMIITGLVYLLQLTLENQGIDLAEHFGLYNLKSQNFAPYQLITNLFLHGTADGPKHILFNMLGLYIFGTAIESRIGTLRFVMFYLFSGVIGNLFYIIINYIETIYLINTIGSEISNQIISEGAGIISAGKTFVDPVLGKLLHLLYIPTIGASGAIFGLLAAYWFFFPYQKMLVFPIPFPIPVFIYIPLLMLFELILLNVNLKGDNVAHLAHLTGAVAGYLILRFIWKYRPNS